MMNNGLSQLELSSIREIAGCHITCANKLNEYVQKCNDNEVKQMFTKAAQECNKSVQALTQML